MYKSVLLGISLEVSLFEVSMLESMNDSSDSDRDANDALPSNVDLSRLALGDEVKILGVLCFTGVLEIFNINGFIIIRITRPNSSIALTFSIAFKYERTEDACLCTYTLY